MHRLGHVSPQAALRYQHATTARDSTIADGIDALVRAARSDTDEHVVMLRAAGGQGRTLDGRTLDR